jgi:glycerophosphoryl diester phosphodiesterase
MVRSVTEENLPLDRELKPYFATTYPQVLAHRGLHEVATENTLGAFAAALAAGATHIETDTHASRDGIAMLFHDPEVLVKGILTPVSSLTARELRALDLGSGQGVPSLEDALVAFPEARFNIDIKSTEAARPAVDVILKHGAQNRVLIASFKAARRTAATRRLPGCATSASAPLSLAAVVLSTIGLTWIGTRLLRQVDAVQLPTTMLGMRVFTPRFVRMCHRAGVVVHAWTINEEDEMRALLALGIDGLVTDRADLAVPVADSFRRN